MGELCEDMEIYQGLAKGTKEAYGFVHLGRMPAAGTVHQALCSSSALPHLLAHRCLAMLALPKGHHYAI